MLAQVSLTWKCLENAGMSGCTLYKIEKMVNPAINRAMIILVYSFDPFWISPGRTSRMIIPLLFQ